MSTMQASLCLHSVTRGSGDDREPWIADNQSDTGQDMADWHHDVARQGYLHSNNMKESAPSAKER